MSTFMVGLLACWDREAGLAEVTEPLYEHASHPSNDEMSNGFLSIVNVRSANWFDLCVMRLFLFSFGLRWIFY